jgi:hypothetical protein
MHPKMLHVSDMPCHVCHVSVMAHMCAHEKMHVRGRPRKPIAAAIVQGRPGMSAAALRVPRDSRHGTAVDC